MGNLKAEMLLFDTHVHVEPEEGAPGIDMLVERAVAAGVTRFIAVGGSPAMNVAAVEAAKRFPAVVGAAIGYDRDQAGRPDLITTVDEREPLVAIGEIGLDFHYHPDTADAQTELFRAQLAMAREQRLPVIVHSREAEVATIDALREHVVAWPGAADRIGVMHCFTGSTKFAQDCLALGFHISFSGIVTFKNAAALRDTAGTVPDNRLLIETDTPYCTPVPHRGKRNEPAYLPFVASCLAEVRGQPLETLARITTGNAQRLFAPP